MKVATSCGFDSITAWLSPTPPSARDDHQSSEVKRDIPDWVDSTPRAGDAAMRGSMVFLA
jgi:hypothetical protein